MTFESILSTIPSWLDGGGPDADIVVSSRARLARNITGIPFAHRAGDEDLRDVTAAVREAAPSAGFDRDSLFINDDLNDLRKHVFIERHLISRGLAAKHGNRGVLVEGGERRSVLVNEEDHLRIQVFRSGFDLTEAYERVGEIDKRFSGLLEYSFSEDYGYLTACPTNMGTGLRVSVLIHLPALVLTNEVPKVIRSAGQLGLAVRGFYGEGSDVVGNLFQISNQRSLGKPGQGIVDDLAGLVATIIEYEQKAAGTLYAEARHKLEDKIWRSLGILKTARMLSTGEFMNFASAVRLGISLGLVEREYITMLNELLVLCQPAHLQERIGGEQEAEDRDRARAELVRQRFIDVNL